MMPSPAAQPPVLLVHGIWDSASRMQPMRTRLEARGIANLTAVDLLPNSGHATIPALALQVQTAADIAIAAEDPARAPTASIDLIGFSMGALVCRYYIQRLGGKRRVRHFVSISGPHRGTWTAYALPWAGVRQMRPGSELLIDLERDCDPWGKVRVHTLTTPYDLMIIPSRGGKLPGSTTHRAFPVLMHRSMIDDSSVIDHVALLLNSITV